MAIRQKHVEKLIDAQREFDRNHKRGRASYPEGNRAAAVIGSLIRNASREEYRAFRDRCGPGGHVPDYDDL